MKDIYKSALFDTGKIINIYDNVLLARSPHNSTGYLFILDNEKNPVKAIDLGEQKAIPRSVFRHYSHFLDYSSRPEETSEEAA